MSLNPNTSFRRAGFALATVAGLMFSNAAGAQTTMPKATPSTAPATQSVSKGNCDAFLHYVADEARTFPKDLSKTFVGSVLRFHQAGCAATDKNGPIYIITMNDQDAASLRTALGRMGQFDIIGASGVQGCARPATNVCPSSTSANPMPRTGG